MMDLDRLEKICQEATKGPWYIENLYSKKHYPEIFQKRDDHWQSIACEVRKDADAIFVAEARTALPLLIARVREAEAELATYKRAYEALRDDVVDDECPFEYDLVNWSDCRTCPHDREMHNDRERDLKCWDRHYFEKAQAERGQE